MFIVEKQGNQYCTPCGLKEFAGVQEEDITAEKVAAFVIKVRQGHVRNLMEVPPTSVSENSACASCRTLLLPLLHSPMGTLQRKWLFTEILGEYLPRERPPLGTDLSPTFWDRKNFIPFESVEILSRDMRVLVNNGDRHYHHGSVVYATNNAVVIEYDETSSQQNGPVVVFYAKTFPGLYLDWSSNVRQEAIAIVERLFFSRLSEQERGNIQSAPAWKATSPNMTVYGDTKRNTIENMYITLCHQGVINDPAVKSTNSSDTTI